MLVRYDPATGVVQSTLTTTPGQLSLGPGWLDVPEGLDIAGDPGAWRVDLDTLEVVLVGRAPADDEIDAERDRRISSGFEFAGHRVQYDPASKQRIANAATLAGFAVAAGALAGDLQWMSDAPFVWITEDNTELPLDAHQMFAMGAAAGGHEMGHIMAARALKNAEPRVVDALDDAHWPPVATVD